MFIDEQDKFKISSNVKIKLMFSHLLAQTRQQQGLSDLCSLVVCIGCFPLQPKVHLGCQHYLSLTQSTFTNHKLKKLNAEAAVCQRFP